MREMHHQNIIRILHAYFTTTSDDPLTRETVLNIVLEFMPATLTRV